MVENVKCSDSFNLGSKKFKFGQESSWIPIPVHFSTGHRIKICELWLFWRNWRIRFSGDSIPDSGPRLLKIDTGFTSVGISLSLCQVEFLILWTLTCGSLLQFPVMTFGLWSWTRYHYNQYQGAWHAVLRCRLKGHLSLIKEKRNLYRECIVLCPVELNKINDKRLQIPS